MRLFYKKRLTKPNPFNIIDLTKAKENNKMWTVFNEFGEVVCEVACEAEAIEKAIEYNGDYRYIDF
jgi:hypothetical protein